MHDIKLLLTDESVQQNGNTRTQVSTSTLLYRTDSEAMSEFTCDWVNDPGYGYHFEGGASIEELQEAIESAKGWAASNEADRPGYAREIRDMAAALQRIVDKHPDVPYITVVMDGNKEPGDYEYDYSDLSKVHYREESYV